MADSPDISTPPRIWQTWRGFVLILLCWLVLAAILAGAQEPGPRVTETVATRSEPGLNRTDTLSERVITLRTETSNGEEVVIETYRPLLYKGRLALSERVRRVTTVTPDGSRTVEETEARSQASPEDPTMRVVARAVTTVRKTGPDSFVSERQEFERDGNGRWVPIRKEVVHTGSR